jgi:hypothetical protein
MSLEVSGKLLELRGEVTGNGARGPWKKREMIIETNEQYPKKICILCWNDRADEIQQLPVGAELKVAISIESREFNDRWYTDVRAWKIETNAEQGFNQEVPDRMDKIASSENTTFSDDDGDDDLPF